MERRFIEESFPIKKIGEESILEKNLRNGYITTLHVWWARKPLSVCRSTIYTSLIPFSHTSKKNNETEFICKLSKWKNSLDKQLLLEASTKIINSNKKIRPKILDIFAGGGSIPLEALRLGCDVSAGDYNPVAVLLLKCTLEYPQKYGIKNEKPDEILTNNENKFLKDVQKYGQWVLEHTKEELNENYPTDKDGYSPVCYLWARSIVCKNPHCKAEIPLLSHFWLSKKKNQNVMLFPIIQEKKVFFKIIGDKYEKVPSSFDPNRGNISRSIAKCFVCNSICDSKTIQEIFKNNESDQKMLAVILHKKGQKGKKYRIPTEDDLLTYNNTAKKLTEKKKSLSRTFGFDAIPTEPLPPKGSHRSVGSQLPLYGFKTFGDLFNQRQQLALLVFIEKVRDAHKKMLDDELEPEYAKAITTFLALAIDRLAVYGSTLCLLNHTGGRGVTNTFSTHALQMIWTYAESNPFNFAGAGWITACIKNEKWIEHASNIQNVGEIFHASADSISSQKESFDAVIIDPPYYDSVAYSYLSDFFYVWLKRSVGFLYPELFTTPLTPKQKEMVVYSDVSSEEGKLIFENKLTKSFKEIHRVLKPGGISVIVYAHKSTAGWETIINSLLDSGLNVTAAWPINTERESRISAKDTASLNSSIYMVCRKWKKESVGFYRDVKKELKTYLDKKLEYLWNEGISGADFFISAIGSAIEVYGKYEKVVDDSDEIISVSKLLRDTREIVTNYAINKVIKSELSDEISQLTRFYILWRWAYGEAKVPFDDARKMAQSVGINLEHEWNKGFIVKEKGVIRTIGPNERQEKDFEKSHDLIDILHQTLLLWKKENRETVGKFLEEKGYKNSEVFKRVAQAISESLPMESTEKKWLDGFLTGFRLIDSQSGVQSKLF